MITVQKNQVTIFLIALMFSGFIQKVRSEPQSTTVTISGAVLPRTCAFEESVQNITLPDVLRSDFSNQDLAGATPFTIKVESCASFVSNLNIRFEGTEGGKQNTFINTGTSEGYSLALFTKESNQSVYDGVALVMPVQQGSGSIDMVAKYQVYSDKPVAGSFKSTVNISLEYN
ncbi:fimbrial protein [Enterobacter ludwigii]|uniref:fimbrial protein n=1 Tax=Enterobacter ludwigii TaxID=299767 RepID=UPI003D211D24